MCGGSILWEGREPRAHFLLYLAQKFPWGQDMSQCAPFAVFDGPIREVEQLTVDGQEVGVAAFQGPRDASPTRYSSSGSASTAPRTTLSAGSLTTSAPWCSQLTYSVASS